MGRSSVAEELPPPVAARIVHQLEGRTRLRLAGEPPHHRLVALADALAAAGFEKVEVRPRTGSIILGHAQPWHSLAEAVRATGLTVLPKAPEPPPKDAITEAGEQVARADLLLQLFSKGQLDLRNLAFLGLTGVGLFQLARGRFAGPALTVLGQAAAVFFARGLRR